MGMDDVVVDGCPSREVTGLRDALDELEAAPTREAYGLACRAADAFVDVHLGKPGARRMTATFAEHGPTLLARFSEWALLVAVAWHESGHAVAGWALGQQPTHATIIPTATRDQVILGWVRGESVMSCYGSDDPEETSRTAGIIALAGDIAEEPYISKSAPGARARHWFAKYDLTSSRGRGTDFDAYTRAAYDRAASVANMPPWIAYWQLETIELLQRHAAKMKRVALALLKHRELDEASLADLLGPMPGGE